MSLSNAPSHEAAQTDEQLWGLPSKPGNGTDTPTSAFASPPMTIDIDENPVNPVHQGSQDTENADVEGEKDLSTSEKADGANGAKPNIALLAVAGVLTLSILGGAGFFIKEKLYPSAVTREPLGLEVLQSSLPDRAAKNVNVFDAAPAAPADAPAAPTLPASVPAAPVAVVVASAASAPASAAVPVVSVAPVVAAAAAAIATPAASAAAAVVTKVAESAAPATTANTAKPAAKTVKPVTLTAQAAKPAVKRVVHANAKPKTSKLKTAKLQKSRFPKKATVPGEPAETYMLPSGLSVKAIFPQTGANAQAWISDSSGRTQVVHIGDTLQGGAKVVAIVGEKGEVVTSSGVITSRRTR